MKIILSLFAALLIYCTSSAQIIHTADKSSPKERASLLTKLYADVLSLDKSQEKQVYSVLLNQQKKLKAISSGKMKADKETLRKAYFGVDDELKDIFTQSQYMEYLTFKSDKLHSSK